MDKAAMYKLSYGLFVLTAQENEKDNGCIINTATQVTSDPNRIVIAVNKKNYTHDMIQRTGRFSVSVISQSADFDLFRRFGFQSGAETDKFRDFSDCRRAANGTLLVTAGTNAYLSGSVISATDLGTHTLFLADVTDGACLSEEPSATYEYYQQQIKPKPQPVGKTSQGKVIWRCMICGYEYEGEELPEDFLCPWCKHPASDFERVVIPETGA